jgi:hypothetical protein
MSACEPVPSSFPITPLPFRDVNHGDTETQLVHS